MTPGAVIRDHVTGLLALFRTRIAGETGVVVAGTVSSALLRVLIIGALAAVLTPEEMGVIAVFIALMEVVSVLADSGLNTAMVRYIGARSAERPGHVVLSSLGLKLGLTALVIAGAWVLHGPYIHRMRIAPEHEWLYPAAIAAGVFLSFHGFGMSVLQGLQRFAWFAVQTVSVNVFRAGALGILLALGTPTLRPMAAWFFAAPALAVVLAGALAAWVVVRREGAPPAPLPVSELAVFTLPLGVLQVLSIANARLNSFMIKDLSTAEDLANYELAYQVAYVFPLLAGALVTVLLPKVSAMQTSAALRDYRRKALGLYPALVIATILAVVIAPWLIEFVFGDKYRLALPVIRWIILAFAIHVITQPLTLIFYAVGRPHYVTVIYAVQLVGLAALNYVLVPRYGAQGAAAALAVATFAAVAAIIVASGRILKLYDAQPKRAAGP